MTLAETIQIINKNNCNPADKSKRGSKGLNFTRSCSAATKHVVGPKELPFVRVSRHGLLTPLWESLNHIIFDSDS